MFYANCLTASSVADLLNKRNMVCLSLVFLLLRFIISESEPDVPYGTFSSVTGPTVDNMVTPFRYNQLFFFEIKVKIIDRVCFQDVCKFTSKELQKQKFKGLTQSTVNPFKPAILLTCRNKF